MPFSELKQSFKSLRQEIELLRQEAVRLLLGQKSVTATSSYLNIDKQAALEIGREFIL